MYTESDSGQSQFEEPSCLPCRLIFPTFYQTNEQGVVLLSNQSLQFSRSSVQIPKGEGVRLQFSLQ